MKIVSRENADKAKIVLQTKNRGSVSYLLLKRIIKELENGVTLFDIANAAHVAQPILHRWVLGKRENINIQTVDSLADYFKLKLQ